jgi:exodeoxyribonuclease VII small subunit
MAKLDFEKALGRLEKIVAEMEANDLNLDQMLAKFKEGVTLAEACSKRLHEAERTVEMLVKGEDGSVGTKPFPDEAAETESADDAGPAEDEDSELPF